MNAAGSQGILVRYAALAAANFVASVFGFLVAALLARSLGPENFGAISLAIAVVSVAVMAATLGTNLYAVRAVAARQATLEEMIPAIVLIRVILGTVVFILLVGVTFVVPKLHECRELIWLFSLTLFTDAILLIWVPQAIHSTNMVAACSALLQLANFLLVYGLLLVCPSIYIAPVAKITADILVATGLMLSIRSYTGSLKPLPDLSGIKAILKECAPIGFTQLIRCLALTSDLIILGIISNLIDTGFYAAAQKLFLFLHSLGGAYFIILVPRLASLSDSNALLNQEIRNSLRTMLPVLIAVLVSIWIGADILMQVLFGDAYGAAADVLRVLALAAFAAMILGHHRNLLLVKKQDKLVFRLTLASCVLHIGAKIVLIPFMGILGCALGTLIGEVFMMIVLWLAASRSMSRTRPAGAAAG